MANLFRKNVCRLAVAALMVQGVGVASASNLAVMPERTGFQTMGKIVVTSAGILCTAALPVSLWFLSTISSKNETRKADEEGYRVENNRISWEKGLCEKKQQENQNNSSEYYRHTNPERIAESTRKIQANDAQIAELRVQWALENLPPTDARRSHGHAQGKWSNEPISLMSKAVLYSVPLSCVGVSILYWTCWKQ